MCIIGNKKHPEYEDHRKAFQQLTEVLFTMNANQSIEGVREQLKPVIDYFESIKLFKFAIFFFFFQKYLSRFNWENCLKVVFFFLLYFNLFHSFNLFHFNEIVMPYYA